MSSRRMRTTVPWCIALGCALAGLLAESQPARVVSAEEPKPTKVEFGPTKVWVIHIDVPADEFAAMPPAPGGGFGPPPAQPPKKDEKKDAKKRATEKNLFGTEFPWVEADVTVNGVTVKKAGLRYSGDITYFVSAQGVKRPLRIGFDRFGGGKVEGLAGVQLQAMPLDLAKARQVVASEVFRAAGVPTPRTAFAEVTLTVPGRHDKAPLGLYTVVEELDSAFLASHFGSDKGLLLRPFGVRGVDHLGDDWERYKGVYRPNRDATPEEAKRVIAFARLVNQGSDEEFQKQIGEFIDVDAFLRFLAANALTSNLESFFALGHNYVLYLNPKTNKFHFLPGDLEFSLAGFLLMGNAEQIMDLSVRKPYPGDNKLPDRLLAIKDRNEQYLKLLNELTQKSFTKEQLLKDVEAIQKATKDIRDKEPKAGPGFGPPAPDLKTFAEKRTASVAAQLAGTSKGFAPQPLQFGPPGGGKGPATAMDEKQFATEVKGVPGFDLTLFAAPPRISYPVAIGCEPSGAVYVAVDEQGSLGRTPGGGRIVRLVDKDGDGKADSSTVYCKVDHPRGVVYRAGKVWVMHPPTLSVFEDTDGDGVADKSEVLVTGLTTSQITERGGDHTTNCVRMGIDGWLYIGVGDYGIREAKGKDGKTITLRGGGVVRVRPDGTELEIYCTGLRNPFDLAIDPFLNLYTRDNTNDGGGWDTRVSLLKQSAHYGYTQLFANFTDETMPTLGTFGNGGGTGAVHVGDPRWPDRFRGMLLTSDWGRSEVYLHDLKPNGPTFDLKQEVILTVPRATGMDIDADGRLYVASWRGGSAVGFEGPNIGFVTRAVPTGLKAERFPDLKALDANALVGLLASPNAVVRLHAQGEILARGTNAAMSAALVKLASDEGAQQEARVAAVFTLKQLDGKASHPALLKLAGPGAVREFALRALTDRTKELDGLDVKPFVAALADKSPRVQAQALISLGRLGDVSAAKHILPLTARTDGSMMPTRRPVQNQPDPGRVVPHLAVRALVALNAISDCLDALDGPNAEGALCVLRYVHDPKAVEGLIKKLGTIRTPEIRRSILVTLIRLYHREADYKGSWWGIRPDNTGPYYDRAEWAMSKRIGAVVTTAVLDADKETATFLKGELARHKVALAGVAAGSDVAVDEKPLVLPKADPKNPDQIANLTYEATVKRVLAAKGDAAKGEPLFKAQSCVACHTTADGQTPKGPHLAEIGKRVKQDELIESILKPSAKLAQGYETIRFNLTDERVVQGFVVGERADATVVRKSDGVQVVIKKTEIESRTVLKVSAMPEGLVANLTPEQLADLIAYLQSR
jgi:putative membrane-bound dehydrogenase-like protein